VSHLVVRRVQLCAAGAESRTDGFSSLPTSEGLLDERRIRPRSSDFGERSPLKDGAAVVLTSTLGSVVPEFLVPLGVVKRSLTIGTKGPSPERSPERGDREIILWRRFTSTSARSVTLTTAKAIMHYFTNLTRRGFLKPPALSAILLTLVGSIYADDKSPKQILGGKPAETSNESSRYYDVHGRFAGRSSARGST
jgi:hypothetical protein